MIKVTININGMNYNLTGEKDEKYLLGVANYVDARIKEIISKKENLSSMAATVLAAVNIADELYECDLELDNAIKDKNNVDNENALLKQKLNEITLQLQNTLNEKISVKDNFGKKEKNISPHCFQVCHKDLKIS